MDFTYQYYPYAYCRHHDVEPATFAAAAVLASVSSPSSLGPSAGSSYSYYHNYIPTQTQVSTSTLAPIIRHNMSSDSSSSNDDLDTTHPSGASSPVWFTSTPTKAVHMEDDCIPHEAALSAGAYQEHGSDYGEEVESIYNICSFATSTVDPAGYSITDENTTIDLTSGCEDISASTNTTSFSPTFGQRPQPKAPIEFSDDGEDLADYRGLSSQQLQPVESELWQRHMSSGLPVIQLRSPLPVYEATPPSAPRSSSSNDDRFGTNDSSYSPVSTPRKKRRTSTSTTTTTRTTTSNKRLTSRQKQKSKTAARAHQSGGDSDDGVVKPVYRRRAQLPRSKNGCWTCRCRRKKCDEQKPGCNTCAVLGLECAGYSAQRPAFMYDKQASAAYRQQISATIRAKKSQE